ncbi:hypothetical protein E2C01_031435 [Portunus trituberculatus]|uniref:Uncharacterized protein n=1 Tax=Portunus trituberculatus TaxID=210409 RepID=A0A5B7EST2_PORTR|nr:hypothetical protein [Portunus trituberculatus]
MLAAISSLSPLLPSAAATPPHLNCHHSAPFLEPPLSPPQKCLLSNRSTPLVFPSPAHLNPLRLSSPVAITITPPCLPLPPLPRILRCAVSGP